MRDTFLFIITVTVSLVCGYSIRGTEHVYCSETFYIPRSDATTTLMFTCTDGELTSAEMYSYKEWSEWESYVNEQLRNN